MTGKDWKDVSVTAVTTAILLVGLFQARPGTTDNPPPKVLPAGPSATVASCKVTATAEQGVDPTSVSATLHIENATEIRHDLHFAAALVRKTFNGSPLSRVAGPMDYSLLPISTQPINLSITAHAAVDFPIKFIAPPLPRQSMYVIDIDNDKTDVTVAEVTPPAAAGSSGTRANQFAVLAGSR